ncbi:unnamed protein product, partial [Protopolystoma xenopodis]
SDHFLIHLIPAFIFNFYVSPGSSGSTESVPNRVGQSTSRHSTTSQWHRIGRTASTTGSIFNNSQTSVVSSSNIALSNTSAAATATLKTATINSGCHGLSSASLSTSALSGPVDTCVPRYLKGPMTTGQNGSAFLDSSPAIVTANTFISTSTGGAFGPGFGFGPGLGSCEVSALSGFPLADIGGEASLNTARSSGRGSSCTTHSLVSNSLPSAIYALPPPGNILQQQQHYPRHDLISMDCGVSASVIQAPALGCRNRASESGLGQSGVGGSNQSGHMGTFKSAITARRTSSGGAILYAGQPQSQYMFDSGPRRTPPLAISGKLADAVTNGQVNRLACSGPLFDPSAALSTSSAITSPVSTLKTSATSPSVSLANSMTVSSEVTVMSIGVSR